jgi:hypothetical protein
MVLSDVEESPSKGTGQTLTHKNRSFLPFLMDVIEKTGNSPSRDRVSSKRLSVSFGSSKSIETKQESCGTQKFKIPLCESVDSLYPFNYNCVSPIGLQNIVGQGQRDYRERLVKDFRSAKGTQES